MNDGKRKKAQKYQNKTGYKIKYDTKAIDHQKKVSLKWYKCFLKKVMFKMLLPDRMETEVQQIQENN